MYRAQQFNFVAGAPTVFCVTRDEVKTFASVTDTALDSVIDLIIPMVQAKVERAGNRLLTNRAVYMEAELPRGGDCYYQLDGYPVTEITAVKVYDGAGGEEAVALGDILVMGTLSPRVRVQRISYGGESGWIRFEYNAGHDAENVIPADWKGDVLRLCATVLANREDYGVSDGAFAAIPEAARVLEGIRRRKQRVR